MIRDWSFSDCFGNKESVDNDDGDGIDPVLLVSGIGGSIMNSKDKKSGNEIRVWVRVLLANWEFQKRAWSIYNPKTGYTESLDKNSEIVVPDDDYGLYAIDILDPSVVMKCLKMEEVYQYHDMKDPDSNRSGPGPIYLYRPGPERPGLEPIRTRSYRYMYRF